MTITYHPFSLKYMESAIRCVTRVYMSDNSIAKALNVSHDEFVPRAITSCRKAIRGGISQIAIHKPSNRVVAFYFQHPFPKDDIALTNPNFEINFKLPCSKMVAWDYFLQYGKMKA